MTDTQQLTWKELHANLIRDCLNKDEEIARLKEYASDDTFSRSRELECVIHDLKEESRLERIKFRKEIAMLRDLVKLAITQNQCDMLLTGEELRKLEKGYSHYQQEAELFAIKNKMEWQPIETAPKTSKAILVWCEERKCTFAVSYYDEQWNYFGGGGVLCCEPTHWMPLPDAPSK